MNVKAIKCANEETGATAVPVAVFLCLTRTEVGGEGLYSRAVRGLIYSH